MKKIEEKKEEINIKKLNDVIGLSEKILRICFACLVLGVVVLILYLGKETKLFRILLNILKVASPLFIGIVIAWLLNPFVTWLNTKKVKRGIGATLVFFIFILILYLFGRVMVPMLYSQMNDFVNTLPSLFTSVSKFISNLFVKLNSTGIDFSTVEKNIYVAIENLSLELTTNLPKNVIGFLTGVISSVGSFGIGLIIGFYLLIDFDGINHLLDFVPKKYHLGLKNVFKKLDGVFKDFVGGTLVISFIMFVITSIGFKLIGLPSPALFGFIVGITNIIPYIGPWIGGAFAVIVGLTVSPLVGILAAVIAFIVQQIDGFALQPIVMSKATKLHPVTIMIGLLIFGYFFGILGMILAVPVISAFKVILSYFDEKYDLLEKLKK